MKATRVGWLILVLLLTSFVSPHHLSYSQSQQQPSAADHDKVLVFAFREAIQNPRVDPRLLGQELHRILIGPELARDLEQAKGQTLMWSLDGVLRYLPVGVLHDGQKYLVERYRNVVFTPASQSRLKDPVTAKWKALGLQRYFLVHIASHFSFKPGNEIDSFLLLGDGTYLTLAQIESLPNVFSGVVVLTLSACDTATGGAANGKEVEGSVGKMWPQYMLAQVSSRKTWWSVSGAV